MDILILLSRRKWCNQESDVFYLSLLITFFSLIITEMYQFSLSEMFYISSIPLKHEVNCTNLDDLYMCVRWM